MFKTILNMLVGAIIAAAVGAAMAVTGTPPIPATGPGLVDGTWLNGLANGQNFSFQNGITAHAGGTQVACLALSTNVFLFSIDTVASTNDSVCMPFASAGSNLSLRNAGANNLAVFAANGNNPATATTDSINGNSNSTSFVVSPNFVADCFSGKNGAWSCARGN